MNQQKIRAALLATAAGVAFVSHGHAQSADALIDKLVDKGILTAKEAGELREEADKDFTKAVSSKNGMPEWVNAFKINGDFRGRYEHFSYDEHTATTPTDRDRFRYRARLGFTATMADNFEVGLRLGSGEIDDGVAPGGIDPISNNQTFQNNAAKKGIFLDLAYGKWSPLNTADWGGAITVGKMENPFLFPSTIMFDRDYTPEGAAVELTYRFNPNQTLKFTGAGYVLDELAADSNDPYMVGAQLRWDATWNTKLATSVGVSAWAIGNSDVLTTAAVPNVGRGNTRNAAGVLQYDYNPIQADAAVTYTFEQGPLYAAPFPITVFGEYLNNPAVSEDHEGYAFGLVLGKSGKKHLWDFSYQYRVLEADAWWEEVVESDFGGHYLTTPTGGNSGYRNGTNVRGHIVRAQYSPFDHLTLGVTYWLTELINESPTGSDSGAGRLQVDAVLKF
jgi:hypothetical protein